MQVKDYLQSLQDDNKIHVEKIGSGNWYWSFTGDESKSVQAQVEKARAERDALAQSIDALKARVEEAAAVREEENGESGESKEGGKGDVEMSRKSLLERNEFLKKDVERLEKEVEAYCDHDPAELERRKGMVEAYREEAVQWTEQILSLESWMRRQTGGDKEQLLMLKRSCYGDEFDEEEQGLKELE